MSKNNSYTSEELLDTLKVRRGALTLKEYSEEIGISLPYLSEILRGEKPIGNEKVLAFLAPKGKMYVKRDSWVLVSVK